MALFVPGVILDAARNLRKSMTEAEKILWNEIKWKKLWVKFLRQKPIFLYEEEKGFPRYCIPDFCSLEKKIVIEVDGEIHQREDVYQLDKEKELLLQQKWFIIIRIENDEISQNIDKVIEDIVASFP